uniref:Uncharacterized protein n=1 Tax=Ciona savignyi TaxID=51511 RepID=H2YG39_CIOSA
MGFEVVEQREVVERPESDRASQQSMVSAGVSGSISTGSTSGYGSVDTIASHARQDRVEMWVRDQQYVRQQQPQLGRNEPWNVTPRQVGSPNPMTPSDSPNEAFRPPVPLYSSWGEGLARYAEVTSNTNNSNNIPGLYPPHVNSLMP